MSSEAASLPTQPFNHLSVLAYLAIGIVVFASSVVTGYLIHSCYRSAGKTDATRDALEKSPTIGDVESGSVYRRGTGRREPSELELKPLAREFLNDEASFLSDSKVYFLQEISQRSYHLMPLKFRPSLEREVTRLSVKAPS
jgi:hypothetical protein